MRFEFYNIIFIDLYSIRAHSLGSSFSILDSFIAHKSIL